MAIDYGHRLQDYAYKVIKDDVGVEFESHLDAWKVQCNNLVLYARLAFQSHQKHLTDIKKALEAQKLREQQFAMFALSLLAGPALSFVSGALQYRVGPLLFGKRTATLPRASTPQVVAPRPPAVNGTLPPPKMPHPSTVPIDRPPGRVPFATRQIVKNPPPLPTKAPPRPQPQLKPKPAEIKVPDKITPRNPDGYDADGSKIKGKVLGDFGGSLISQFGIKPGISAVVPDQTQLKNAVAVAKESVDLDMLATKTENVWVQAKSTGRQAIQFYANTFREDSTWGDRLWAELSSGKHGASSAKGEAADRARFEVGKRHIRSIVDQQREVWARKADWFYYGNAPAPISQAQVVNAVEVEMWALWIHAEQFQPVPEDSGFCSTSEVQEQLSGFPRCPMGHAKGNSGIGLDAIYSRLIDLGVAPHVSYFEASRRVTNPGLLPVEIQGIEGRINTEKELETIHQWAQNRKPVMFGGKLGSVPRSMGSLKVTGEY